MTTAAVVLAAYPTATMALLVVVQLLVNARRRRHGWLVGYFTPDASQLVHQLADRE